MKSTYDSPTIEPIGGTGADLNAGIMTIAIVVILPPPVISAFVGWVIYMVRPDDPPVVG